MDGNDPPSGLRKAPQQKRSRERWQLIVDTAAQLFFDLGYERTTTNAIASAAQVSIGTLYQYFPDKAAILGALVDRYAEDLRQMFSSDSVDDNFDHVIDRLIDKIAAYDQSHVAFRAMLASSGQAPKMHQVLRDQVVAALIPRNVLVPLTRIQSVATVALSLVRGLMGASELQDLSPTEVLSETKRALKAYLRDALLQ